MWFKTSGWKKSESNNISDNTKRLDNLGATIEVLSSFSPNLSAAQMQFILAVKVLAAEDGWVRLGEVKNKMTLVEGYQFSRLIKQLLGKSSIDGKTNIFSIFKKYPPMIEVRGAAESAREKDVRLTALGMIVINRTLQTVNSPNPSSESMATDLENSLFKLGLVGYEITSPKENEFFCSESLLITTGSNGVGALTHATHLANESIAKGLGVYWIDFKGNTSIVKDLTYAAKKQYRLHSVFHNLPDSPTSIDPSEALYREAICIDQLRSSNLNGAERIEQFPKIMSELAEAAIAGKSNGLYPAHIVISDIQSLDLLIGGDAEAALNDLIEAGTIIHIIQLGSPNDNYEYLYEKGFAHLAFCQDDALEMASALNVDTNDLRALNIGQVFFRSSNSSRIKKVQLDFGSFEWILTSEGMSLISED